MTRMNRRFVIGATVVFILVFLPIFHFGFDGLRLWLFSYTGEGEYSEWHNGNLTNFPTGISTYTLIISSVPDNRKISKEIAVGKLPPVGGKLQIVGVNPADMYFGMDSNIYLLDKLEIELQITETSNGRNVYHYRGPIRSRNYEPFGGIMNGWQLYDSPGASNPINGFDFPASGGPYSIRFSVTRPLNKPVLTEPAVLQIFGSVGGK